MVRSATVLLAVLFLPGFLSAQQAAPGNHTVVRGDCLWDLAEHFYKDPWQWRRIWEANKDKIKDPNLIFPGQVFVIPGTQGKVTEVEIEPKPAEAPAQAPAEKPRKPVPTPGAPTEMASRHTIFYNDTASFTRAATRSVWKTIPPLAKSEVYAAPWLTRGDSAPPVHVGSVTGHVVPSTPTDMFLLYDRVALDLRGETPKVGQEFLAYRVSRIIPEVGQVVTPTGTITVTEVRGGKVTGVVSQLYGRLSTGDLVGPVPSYDLKPGQSTTPVANGPEAMVMGTAEQTQVTNVGQIVFLDLGSDDGIAVGDEFEVRDWVRGGHRVEGRLQVIGVKPQTSSARVAYLLDDVVHQGIVVRLASKMD